MAIGAARSLSAELDRSAPSSGTATIVARCEAGVERWTLAIQVDVHRVGAPQFRWAQEDGKLCPPWRRPEMPPARRASAAAAARWMRDEPPCLQTVQTHMAIAADLRPEGHGTAFLDRLRPDGMARAWPAPALDP